MTVAGNAPDERTRNAQHMGCQALLLLVAEAEAGRLWAREACYAIAFPRPATRDLSYSEAIAIVRRAVSP